jgi:Fic family protein
VNIDALAQSPVGQLVPIHGTDSRTLNDYDYFAFVPEHLPPADEVRDWLTMSTWSSVAEAAGALGRLRQACHQLPNPELLITPALYREAQATSELEGTYSPLDQVFQAKLPGVGARTPEMEEILAYVEAAKAAFEQIPERPLSINLLCAIQEVIAKGSTEVPPDPGQVRNHQVVIGPKYAPIEESRFVPPPPGDQLRAGLDNWEMWVTADDEMPIVLKAAIAHYQFETLHPFSDCNGRVGRLVIILQLLADASGLPTPALTISSWLLRHRTEYQERLLGVSTTGDWNPWVKFMSRALKEQCERHVSVAEEVLAWLDGVRHTLQERHWTGLISNVAEDLIQWPTVTATAIRDRHNVTAVSAQRSLDRLAEIGAIRELTGRTYRRVYGADRVMRLVESL